MYPVGWTDALELLPSEVFDFQTSGIEIPPDNKDNLCKRAYQKLQNDFVLPPVNIHLHKVIPTGAGLGGGSADAAFVFRSLNNLFQLQLSTEKLEQYASELGSDCAFFIQNKAAFCFDRGNEFEEINLSLKGKFLVLVYPQIPVSSAEAYQGVRPEASKKLKELIFLPIESWKDQIVNDFEKSIFIKYPLIAKLKDWLYQKGAVYASMSGSGSTVYGIFEKEVAIKKEFRDFRVWEGYL